MGASAPVNVPASSYHTVASKIIIKDICSGDSTFIIEQVRIKATCSAINVIKDNMAAEGSTVTRADDSLATDNQLCM